MRIGEVSERTGVAARMLRYYESQGLVSPPRHANGYRDYAASDLQAVTTIRDLTRSGVPVRLIKVVLDKQAGSVAWTRNCDATFVEMIRSQIDDLEGKISCLTTSRDSLTEFLRSTEASLRTTEDARVHADALV